MSISCIIGMHNWKRKGGFNIWESNVKEYYYVCTGCGKRKTVYVPKNRKND
jgi:hypothetical protein